MAIKLIEPYAVTYLRSMVKESLQYHGEQCVLLRLFHPEIDEDVGQCPRCSQDVYRDGEELCPVCYGTNLYDYKNQIGGVKEAYRAWAIFGDHVVTETHMNYGVVAPDQRQVQTEAFPMLIQNDVIVRVKRWDYVSHTALSEGEFYKVSAVTRDSLRTGAHYGQTREDVVGQSFQVAKMPEHSVGIAMYPIQNVQFDEYQVIITPNHSPVTTPSNSIKYVTVPFDQTDDAIPGTVLGGEMSESQVFTFSQDFAITPWVITHSLGHDPNVTIQIYVNGTLTEVDADVTYPNATTVQIAFATAQAGQAELI